MMLSICTSHIVVTEVLKHMYVLLVQLGLTEKKARKDY